MQIHLKINKDDLFDFGEKFNKSDSNDLQSGSEKLRNRGWNDNQSQKSLASIGIYNIFIELNILLQEFFVFYLSTSLTYWYSRSCKARTTSKKIVEKEEG